MKSAAKFTIQGTVQGVFYRQFTKQKADELRLTGFIRNLENNDVEVYAEGEKEDLKKLFELLKQGPPHSQIRNVNVEEKTWTGDFPDFRILRF